MQELRLGEGFQLARRLFQAASGRGHIQFHDFLTGCRAGVRHRHGCREAVLTGLHYRLGIGERGIAEAETERVGNVLPFRLVIAVTHPDVLGIKGVIDILLRVIGSIRVVIKREVGRGRHIPVIVREGHRELAGRIDLALEDVGNGVRAFLARRPGQQDGIGPMLPGSGFDDAADVQDDNHPLAAGVEGLAHIPEQVALDLGEFEVAGERAVAALAGIAAENHHRHIVVAGLDLNGGSGQGRLGADYVLPGHLLPFQRTGGPLAPVPIVIEGFQLLIQLETSRLQGVCQVHDIGLVDLARAGTACDEMQGGGAVQGDLFVAAQRQGAAVVPQEDDGLGRGLTSHGGVGLQIRLAGILVPAEAGRFHDEFQHAADIGIKLFLADAAVLDSGQNPLVLLLGAGFHHVVAGIDRLHGAFLVAPVGHHDARETPLFLQDGGEEFPLLLREIAVQGVVGGHHGPRLSFLDGDFEVLEVNFPESALADQGVIPGAVRLLVVGGEMLDRGPDSVRLDAPHIGGGHLPGEDRIFRKILEIPTAERVPVDVHPRGQERVDAVSEHLAAHRRGHPLHQFRIPGTGNQGAHGEARRHALRRIPVRVDPDAGGAIGEDGGWDAQPLHGPRAVRDARHVRVGIDAHQQVHLLLQGQGLQDFVDVVHPQPRLRGGCQRGQRQNAENE